MGAPDKMKYNFFEIDKQGNLKKAQQNFVEKQKAEKDFYSQYLNVNVGYSLVTPILAGVIIGIALDNKFHKKPVFTVFFIFFGMISSIYNLYRIIKDERRKGH
jgi:F0F1-type ATP synthase assembly protein I